MEDEGRAEQGSMSMIEAILSKSKNKELYKCSSSNGREARKGLPFDNGSILGGGFKPFVILQVPCIYALPESNVEHGFQKIA